MKGGIERFLVVDEEDFKLFHGDSFKVMPYLEQFEMLFIDPPFFTWQTGSPGDKKPDHNSLSYETYRRLAIDGCAWLCGTQPQLVNDWRWWKRFYTMNFELIQSKNVGAPAISRKQLRRTHENIWCIYRSKDKPSDLKITVDRVTKKGKTTRAKATFRLWGEGSKKWRTGVGYPISVFRCKKVDKHHPEYVGHPTQKPEALIELIIKMSTEEGDWVLDPFGGSGTVATVCKRINRKCVTIEIDGKWIEVIKKRVQNEARRTAVTDFFDESLADAPDTPRPPVRRHREKLTDFVEESEE